MIDQRGGGITTSYPIGRDAGRLAELPMMPPEDNRAIDDDELAIVARHTSGGDTGPSELPLGAGLDAVLDSDLAHFSTPGHKRSPLVASDAALLRDIPLLCGIEDQRLSRDLLGRAQDLAAKAWGADWTRFSVQGSTHPNLALALTVTRPDSPVIVGRTSHKSVMAGLVLTGARPIWVTPELVPAAGVAAGIAPDAVEVALRDNPAVTAVWIPDPNYVGVLSDLPKVASHAHAHGTPLIVDQAWGAHFGFHPRLPPTALRQGSDCVVISVHKTLTAFSQGAMLHAVDYGRVDLERLAAAIDALHTTSASGVILASLDRARQLVQLRGEDLLEEAFGLADDLRGGLKEIEGVRLVEDSLSEHGWHTDPLKIAVDISATGIRGFEVEEDLRSDGVQLLMADAAHLIPLVTIGDSPRSIRRLLAALRRSISRRRRGRVDRRHGSLAWGVTPEVVVTPREAFLGNRKRVSASKAADRIAAETIVPYPPGVPAVVPGERLTPSLLVDLQEEVRAGTRIIGASDPALETLLVLCDGRQSR